MSRTKLLNGELTAEQRIIAEYIDQNASAALVNKINAGDKGMSDCLTFITNQARKKAGSSRCVCVSDEEVYGWAFHYFEEDSIKKDKEDYKAAAVKSKDLPVKKEVKAAAPKEKTVPAPKPKDNMIPGQMSIFDLMGGAQ